MANPKSPCLPSKYQLKLMKNNSNLSPAPSVPTLKHYRNLIPTLVCVPIAKPNAKDAMKLILCLSWSNMKQSVQGEEELISVARWKKKRGKE